MICMLTVLCMMFRLIALIFIKFIEWTEWSWFLALHSETQVWLGKDRKTRQIWNNSQGRSLLFALLAARRTFASIATDVQQSSIMRRAQIQDCGVLERNENRVNEDI